MLDCLPSKRRTLWRIEVDIGSWPGLSAGDRQCALVPCLKGIRCFSPSSTDTGFCKSQSGATRGRHVHDRSTGPHMADQSLDFCWRQIFTLPTVFRVGSTTYPMPVNRYCSQNSRFRHHKPPLKSRRKSRAESATVRNLDRLRTVRASSGRKGYNWSEPLACSLSTLVVRGGAVAWTTRHRVALQNCISAPENQEILRALPRAAGGKFSGGSGIANASQSPHHFAFKPL